ncbi:MAG: hypothetical protein WC100_22305 [Sterolibacterium sp.]
MKGETMFSKFDKAFAALLVSGLVPIITYLTGWEISAEMQAGIVAVLSTLFVWIVPNKTA